jgi:hypothetical protein
MFHSPSHQSLALMWVICDMQCEYVLELSYKDVLHHFAHIFSGSRGLGASKRRYDY